MQVQSLGQEDPLEEDMATHSSILAWRIPVSQASLTEESATSIESQKVGHEWSNLAQHSKLETNIHWAPTMYYVRDTSENKIQGKSVKCLVVRGALEKTGWNKKSKYSFW